MPALQLSRELYTVRAGVLLAENIDRAWGIYLDEARDVAERRVAQEFLIYAFDIRSLDNLNRQLTLLMTDRNLHKAANPEYIPNLSPKHLNLAPHEMRPAATDISKLSMESDKLNLLFFDDEMLDVTAEDKVEDLANNVPLYDERERAKERVHIHRGHFYKSNTLFDTTSYSSHEKDNFAAFTLNANGELSVFTHPHRIDGVVHSTMNAGSPVVGAGEVQIKDGKLLAITTYSGHYAPSLFNIYRTLSYFAEKGIDISQTKVHTQSNPADFGVALAATLKTRTDLDGNVENYYELNARDFVDNTKAKLERALNTAIGEVRKYQASGFKQALFSFKDKITSSTLTAERKQLATELHAEMRRFREDLNSKPSREMLDDLIERLVDIQTRDTALSRAKGADAGRLQSQITSCLRDVRAIRSELPEELSEPQTTGMKAMF